MGYNTRADADPHWTGYGRVIHTLGRTHPGRIPRYCTLLAQVARTATPDERPFSTTHNTVQLAIQLNRPGNACLQDVLRQWATYYLRRTRQCQPYVRQETLQN